MQLKPPFRKIIHVDMDAYYASVAQLDNPELKGKPIAVGGGGDRGVVSAASYEARRFGVKSAMSNVLAKKKCPHIVFVKTDFARYKEFTSKIRAIFYEYTDLVEPLSLDEAYLDVTENKKGNPSANDIAREIRQRIFEETGLHSVFFGSQVSGPLMPALTYMLSFKNMEERNSNWAKFSAHPEWKRISKLPMYANSVSDIKRTFLKPLAYSQL